MNKDDLKDVISKDRRFFKRADLTKENIITILKEALNDKNWDIIRQLIKRLDN